MKVFIEELRKILRPLPLLVLAVFTALYAFVFMTQFYSMLNEYHTQSDRIQVCADLTKLAGTALEPKELDGAIQSLEEKYNKEIQDAIDKNPVFAGVGVTDYQSYCALETKIGYSRVFPDEDTPPDVIAYLEKEREALASGETIYADYAPFEPGRDYTLTPAEKEYSKLQGDELLGYANWKLKFVGEIEQLYIALDNGNPYDFAISDRAKTTIQEIYASGEMRNIFPGDGFIDYTAQTFMMLAILIIATVCLLFAPVLTRDNMTGVRALQYSSKTGRKTLRVQLCAMISAAFLIAALEIAVTFAVFLGGNWKYFLNSKLNTFINRYEFSWFKGTFGQYLLCAAILIAVVSMGALLFVFLLSKVSKNYISLILGLVPVLGALGSFCFFVFYSVPFSITNAFSLSHIFLIPYAEAYVCGLLLLGGAVAAVVMVHRQTRAEIA